MCPTETLIARPARRPACRDGALRAVVSRAAAGDEEAWEWLVARFGRSLHAVARAHGLDPAAAEDVVQTTWLRLFERAPSLREPAALGGWLATTARHESLSVLRRGRREEPSDPQTLREPPVAAVDASRLAVAERVAGLRAALSCLPPHQRRLLELLVAEPDLPYAAVAAALSIPIGSIGPTRARALRVLAADPQLRSAALAVTGA